MFKRLILFTMILFVFGVIVLELISRNKCADLDNEDSTCYRLETKYFPDTGIEDSIENINRLMQFIAQEEKEINKDSINSIIDERTMEIERRELNGANGLCCGLHNYIAKDLPNSAKKYVKVHEAVHMLGVRNETKTNYLAAYYEPIGFIQTITYTIYNSLGNTNISNIPCVLGSAWNSFKIYFLNLSTF